MILRALACVCVLLPMCAMAQSSSDGVAARGQIVGRVSDAEGKPIPGANVTVLGAKIGASTDDGGRFRIVMAQSSSDGVAARGQIVGRVSDAEGKPIPGANVTVLGAKIGASTDDGGRFRIVGVTTGVHEVRAQVMGRAAVVKSARVDAGVPTTLDFALGTEDTPVRKLPEYEIRGAKPLDPHRTSSEYKIDREKLNNTPGIDNYIAAVALSPGVVVDASGVHVRGSRSDELKVEVGGIVMTNPLSGENVALANLAVDDVSLHTGTQEAEFGGALSGIVSVNTREGTDRFSGELRWDTDRYGDPTKTYDDFDRLTLALGGPAMVRGLTWFATYEGVFQDLYPDAHVTEPRQTLWDFIRLGNRQSNQINANLKLAYRAGSRDKITLEAIRNRSSDTPYEHMWSRRGFVQLAYDTLRHDGQPDQYRPKYGSWSATQVDSTYQPVNMPDHVPTDVDRFGSLTAAWTRQLSCASVWTTRLSTIAFDHLTSVGRKQPWDYWVQSPEYWDGNTVTGTEDNLFFATHGDYPVYAQRNAATWVTKTDFASGAYRGHLFKAGLEARYSRVRNLAIQAPNGDNHGLPGNVRSDFLNYNPEGSSYVQDRWEFEGMILNAGLRFDFFTPGDQIATADLPSGKRYKQQLSPRLGIAYPISDRDALSFNYGWTYQTPSRNYVFENRGLSASVATRGNPDLNPETDVSYQAAVQHLFNKDVSGQFAVFFRDIYGLITVRADRDEFGNQITRYVNRDYASARGFEASVTKSFSHKFSAEANYTYQIATGVASDPRQAQQFFAGGRLYLPISELPLAWDQRNTLSLQGTVRDPARWGLRLLWQYGSGQPFTPTFRNDRHQDPKLANSRRLPATSTLNLDGDRYFKLWNRPMTLFVDARNVLDARNLASLSQSIFPNPFVGQSGDEYLIYYTETGRAGGAYLQDTNGDNVLEVPVRDPRVFQEGRNVRMGLSLTF